MSVQVQFLPNTCFSVSIFRSTPNAYHPDIGFLDLGTSTFFFCFPFFLIEIEGKKHQYKCGSFITQGFDKECLDPSRGRAVLDTLCWVLISWNYHIPTSESEQQCIKHQRWRVHFEGQGGPRTCHTTTWSCQETKRQNPTHGQPTNQHIYFNHDNIWCWYLLVDYPS